MYASKKLFFYSFALAALYWCSPIHHQVSRAESDSRNPELVAQISTRSVQFRNYWDRFKIYPGRLRPNRALVIADGGSLDFEDKITCADGLQVWIHTPLEPQVVLDVEKTTRVSIESTNFTSSLVVVIADDDLNILSCKKGALPGAQINTLTLETGTYGVWYGVRAGYQPSRFLHSKLWITN